MVSKRKPPRKIAPKPVASKVCARCSVEKSAAEFPPNKSLADGLAAYCRECKRAAERERRNPTEADGDGSGLQASKADFLANVPPPRSGGRPTTITKAVIEAVTACLKRGHTRRASARRAGVNEDTFASWMKRGGEEKTGLAREFHDAVLEAEGEGEFSLFEVVRGSAEIDSHQARWILERRYSQGAETYARKEHLDVNTGTQVMEVSIVRELLTKRVEGLGQSKAQASGEVGSVDAGGSGSNRSTAGAGEATEAPPPASAAPD